MKKRRQKKLTMTTIKAVGAGSSDSATVTTTTGDNDDINKTNVAMGDTATHPQPQPQKEPKMEHISTAMSLPTPQALALTNLKSYCQDHDVFISPLLAAKSYPSRGLGVYAIRPVRKGMKLIHVPTKALFTTQSIPESFLSKTAMKEVSVHCTLAMFLAFGNDEDVKVHKRWMETWPGWEAFAKEMPVFWGADFRMDSAVEESTGEEGRARKRRKTLSDTDNVAAGHSLATPTQKLPVFSRSPGIDTFWLTQPSSLDNPALSHLSSQASKIRSCVEAVDKHFPHLKIRSPASHSLYLRFLHMWSCVNTRCFYYLRPGQAPPEDSNEAMALCAFQDLFNHSDARGLTSMFDKRGYFVHADRDYEVGEELLLRYGQHDNDMLWMEYGFSMDKNKHDTVRIDQVVLTEFNDKEKETLTQCEYLGQYNLKMNGVCYRTIVASYLGILDKKQWKRFIAGGLDPELSTAFEEVRLKAKRRIVNWILLVRTEAEQNLKVILAIRNEDELINCFVGEASLTEEQRQSKGAKVEVAKRRKAMCVRRWRQIFDVCMNAIQEIEKECPGSFLLDESDSRTDQNLELTSDEFVRSLEDEKSRDHHVLLANHHSDEAAVHQ